MIMWLRYCPLSITGGQGETSPVKHRTYSSRNRFVLIKALSYYMYSINHLIFVRFWVISKIWLGWIKADASKCFRIITGPPPHCIKVPVWDWAIINCVYFRSRLQQNHSLFYRWNQFIWFKFKNYINHLKEKKNSDFFHHCHVHIYT